jgi:hypothetical protein
LTLIDSELDASLFVLVEALAPVVADLSVLDVVP